MIFCTLRETVALFAGYCDTGFTVIVPRLLSFADMPNYLKRVYEHLFIAHLVLGNANLKAAPGRLLRSCKLVFTVKMSMAPPPAYRVRFALLKSKRLNSAETTS